MKPGQFALLVLAGAIAGVVAMSVAENIHPAHHAHVSAEGQEPAQVAPTAPALPPITAEVPKALPAPERREAPKPQRFTQKSTERPAPALPSTTSGPTVVPPPARTEPENVTPAGSPGSTPAPPPRQVTLNAGLLIPVRLSDGLSTERNAPGDAFHASLDEDLALDGLVIAERGARVEGKVVEADRGSATKAATLMVELTRLFTNDGQIVLIQTNAFERQAESTGSKAIALPASTRVTFRVRAPVRLTERLRQR